MRKLRRHLHQEGGCCHSLFDGADAYRLRLISYCSYITFLLGFDPRAPPCVHAVHAAYYVAIPPHVVDQIIQLCEDNDQEEATHVEATRAPSYFDARWAEA